MKPKPRGGEGKGERWWHPRQWKASWRSMLQPARGPGGLFPLKLRATSWQLAGLWGTGGLLFSEQWQGMATTLPAQEAEGTLGATCLSLCLQPCSTLRKISGSPSSCPLSQPDQNSCLLSPQSLPLSKTGAYPGTCAYVSLGYSFDDLGTKRLFCLLSNTNIHLV